MKDYQKLCLELFGTDDETELRKIAGRLRGGRRKALSEEDVELAVKMQRDGKTTKEIAAERFSSIHTVTTHRKNIFRKLGINTAHEAVKYALRAGLIDPSEFYI